MIFICYRREDTGALVTNLHRRLVERFGEEHVFVDFKDIPPGEPWPDTLRRKLEESRVLLAIIGPEWGDARFTTGKQRGRLRLDDPDDWVRQEICTAIRRRNQTRVVVVRIDDATLPETEWNCELDRLPDLQHARIRNQGDFERDFIDLCDWLERQIPELKRGVDGRQEEVAATAVAHAEPSHRRLEHYLATELHQVASIQLPLILQNGQPVVAPIDELRIDLPLIVNHEHAPAGPQSASLWIGREVLSIHELFRSTHTNALLVDRASRFDDIRRDCDIGDKLAPGSRLVVVGDPGCGKSTLLQWITHYYASLFTAGPRPDDGAVAGSPPLPVRDWVPVMILCRDLASQALPTRFADLLRIHLKLRQFSDTIIASLIPSFERLLEQGRAILLIDGLDEIPRSDQRIEFCKLLTLTANRFPDAPIVVTSRVVGFQAVRDELAARYDHLLVGPLDRSAKQAFIERWSKLIGWKEEGAAKLVQQVCNSRVTAKLTENVFLLAMVAQIQLLDHKLPGRRVDIYRRTVQLMIQRRQPFAGPPLSVNELIPHLEFLAYRMRKLGVQRCSETEVVSAFNELRRLEPDEVVLQTRTPQELLRACIDSVGILNMAGVETDRRGFDRQVIQFFHQSFQEYFAGQAINHGHDAAGREGPVARLRDLLATIEIREREVDIWGEYKIVEPVIADYWQEAVRMGIADLEPEEANDAILMLLPDPTTSEHETRPRAVFALQCLADEPQVSEQTVLSVFDAAIDCLDEADGFNTVLHTWMDEALAAVSESVFGQRLHDRMLEGFIHSRGTQRERLGCCMILRSGGDSVPVTSWNAEALLAAMVPGLTSDRQAERVQTALELMYRFYLSQGKLGFLPPDQQERLQTALSSAFSTDEASECAAMWALLWLTGAKIRTQGINPDDASDTALSTDFVLLNPQTAAKIETILRRPDLDASTLAFGCRVLTRKKGADPVIHQRDWIHALAVIADGVTPRRDLPPIRPASPPDSVEWITDRLNSGLPLQYSGRMAQSLGSFGIYVPAMVEPLRFLFTSETYSLDERDEALIYLAMIGTSEVASILIGAADTPPSSQQNDYPYSRGLFGLLLLDDVDILAEQFRKALPHSDLNAYAYGLAGSRNPRGRPLLDGLRYHANENIRAAVELALARPWVSPPR
jgi:hypothetical protein